MNTDNTQIPPAAMRAAEAICIAEVAERLTTVFDRKWCEAIARIIAAEMEPKTMRQIHEEAAGMGLEDGFFAVSDINPNHTEVEHLKATAAKLRAACADAQHDRFNLEARIAELEAQLAEAKKDSQIVDFLEDSDRCYWMDIQSQPSGAHIICGQGKIIRDTIKKLL